MIFIRLAGLFFALVQITLVLRLALPFVDVPQGLLEYVPGLLELTDLWLVPVEAVLGRFELTGVAGGLAGAADSTVSGPDEFEPLVLIAMLFWGVAAAFALSLLRMVFRPGG